MRLMSKSVQDMLIFNTWKFIDLMIRSDLLLVGSKYVIFFYVLFTLSLYHLLIQHPYQIIGITLLMRMYRHALISHTQSLSELSLNHWFILIGVLLRQRVPNYIIWQSPFSCRHIITICHLTFLLARHYATFSTQQWFDPLLRWWLLPSLHPN